MSRRLAGRSAGGGCDQAELQAVAEGGREGRTLVDLVGGGSETLPGALLTAVPECVEGWG